MPGLGVGGHGPSTNPDHYQQIPLDLDAPPLHNVPFLPCLGPVVLAALPHVDNIIQPWGLIILVLLLWGGPSVDCRSESSTLTFGGGEASGRAGRTGPTGSSFTTRGASFSTARSLRISANARSFTCALSSMNNRNLVSVFRKLASWWALSMVCLLSKLLSISLFIVFTQPGSASCGSRHLRSFSATRMTLCKVTTDSDEGRTVAVLNGCRRWKVFFC